MALQNGEIDATQGLPYSSYNLFEENDQFKISSADTSRVYQVAFNFDTPVLQDLKVRQAICSAIDKDAFCKTLLNGRGTPAVGAFPSNFEFGNNALTGPSFDKEKSKSLLAEAGWIDTDGDGYVDKNGQKLTIRWLGFVGCPAYGISCSNGCCICHSNFHCCCARFPPLRRTGLQSLYCV